MPLTDDQETYLSSLLQGLEPESGQLYPSAKNFVADQVKRHEQYGQRIFISPKQMKWLEDLYKQFVGELPAGNGPQDPERTARADMRDDDDDQGELPDDIDDEIAF